jgi:hypothetical protein
MTGYIFYRYPRMRQAKFRYHPIHLYGRCPHHVTNETLKILAVLVNGLRILWQFEWSLAGGFILRRTAIGRSEKWVARVCEKSGWLRYLGISTPSQRFLYYIISTILNNIDFG